jgi:hypothetical protein
MPIEFDFEGARKSGATDKDISGYFKEKYSIDFDIEGAKKNGANDSDILDYLNTKYSEPVKKKEPAIGLGYEKPSEALRMGGLPKQEKLSQSPLKTAETTTQLDFTRPQPRLSAEEQQAQGMVTKQIKAEKALEFKEGVKQKLYDNTRYFLLQDKKEAQDLGIDLKTLYNERAPELINNYLDDIDQREANALLNHLELKTKGDEKATSEALQEYYKSKTEQRAKYQSELADIQSEYENIAGRINSGELDPNLGQSTLNAINKKKEQLELSQQAFLKPKEALKSFVQENATEIASVAKPSQTPYEQLQQYTNTLYAKVKRLKSDLGYEDMGKGATLGGYAQDYAIRAEQDGGELLDELYAEEFKLKNAVKLLYLNRTPIPANESALGVLGKSFGNSLAPNLQKEQGTAVTIANNVKEIIEDAKIGEKVYKEQQAFAEDAAKPYEKYSAKWFAEPVGASLAIVPEFIIGSLLTEGVLGVTKLGKLLTLAEKYGKIKGLNTTAKYVNAINKNAAGRVTGKLADTFIKTQANGLKFGATSEIVSKFFPSQEDELNFTTGYFGGVIGKGAELALSGAAKNIFKVFGNKGTDAIKRINDFGGTLKLLKDAPKTVLGEVGEEFGESLGQIYKQSNSWKEVSEKIKEQYGTLDKATEFVILTGVMALGMGAGNSIGSNLFTASKEAYNELPREQRAIADSILDQAKAADKQIEETVAEDIKKDIEKDLTPIELKEIETTTDGEGTIEGTVSAGTDVAQEGLGVANEPSGEGITGEGVQAEKVLVPRNFKEEAITEAIDNERGYLEKEILSEEQYIAERKNKKSKFRKVLDKLSGVTYDKYLKAQQNRLALLNEDPLAYFEKELADELKWQEKNPEDANPRFINYLNDVIDNFKSREKTETVSQAPVTEKESVGVVKKVKDAFSMARKLSSNSKILVAGLDTKAANYTNKDGIEVSLKDDDVIGEINGEEVQADFQIDYIGNEKGERGKGLASKELDRILAEADKNNLSVSLVVDSKGATTGPLGAKTGIIGLSNNELKKWYESKGFIFNKNSLYGYRPKKTEDASKYKADTYQAKEGEIKVNENLEGWSSPQDLREAFYQEKLKEGFFYEDGDKSIYTINNGKLKLVDNVNYDYRYEKDANGIVNFIEELSLKETPTAEAAQTTKPIAEQIADLRAAEQAEYDAMANPKDKAKREKIYNKYDKLITPLIDEQKAAESAPALKDVESTAKALEDINTFDQQDAKAEVVVGKEKDRWGRSQVWRERIENAGDILRELSGRGKNPDIKYLQEKIDKIKNWILNGGGFNELPKNIKNLKDVDESNVRFSSAVDGKEYLDKFHKDVLQETIDAYKGIVVKTQEEQVVKDFILTLLQGDKSSIYSKLREVEDIVGKIKKQGELKSTPLNVSEDYHKAKADGSNPEYVAAVEELLGKPTAETTKPSAKLEPVKEVAKPTKTERKAIAEAKIDDLAAKAKEFLRNKNLPEGTQVSGISQNKVIDLMASTVKALVNSGIEIAEAIKQVREFFEQDFDTSAVKDYQIAQTIARDELTDVAKENGFSSYREAVFAVNKYVREVGKEDVITEEEIIKAKEAKDKEAEAPKKGYTSKKKKAQEGEKEPVIKESGRSKSYAEGRVPVSDEYNEVVNAQKEYYEQMNQKATLAEAEEYLAQYGDTEQGLIDAYDDMMKAFRANPFLDARNAIAIELLADRMFARALDFKKSGQSDKYNRFLEKSEDLRKEAFKAHYKAGQFNSAVAVFSRSVNPDAFLLFIDGQAKEGLENFKKTKPNVYAKYEQEVKDFQGKVADIKKAAAQQAVVSAPNSTTKVNIKLSDKLKARYDQGKARQAEALKKLGKINFFGSSGLSNEAIEAVGELVLAQFEQGIYKAATIIERIIEVTEGKLTEKNIKDVYDAYKVNYKGEKRTLTELEEILRKEEIAEKEPATDIDKALEKEREKLAKIKADYEQAVVDKADALVLKRAQQFVKDQEKKIKDIEAQAKKAAIAKTSAGKRPTISDLLQRDLEADLTKEAIAKNLMTEGGLSEREANKLAEIYYNKYRKILKEKIQAQLVKDLTPRKVKEIEAQMNALDGKPFGKTLGGLIANQVAAGVLDSESLRAAFAAKYGIPNVSPIVAANIRSLSAKVRAAKTTLGVNLANKNLLTYINSTVKTKTGSIISTLYYTSILSGVSTAVVNTYGNVNNLINQSVENFVQSVIEAKQGNKGNLASNAQVTAKIRKAVSNLVESFTSFIDIMAYGGGESRYSTMKKGTFGGFESEDLILKKKDLKDLGLKKAFIALAKLYKTPAAFFVRNLPASDEGFYMSNFNMEATRELRKKLYAEGLRGAELEKQVYEQVYGTKDIKAQAINEAIKELKRIGIDPSNRKLLVNRIAKEIILKKLDETVQNAANELAKENTFRGQPRGATGYLSQKIPQMWLVTPFVSTPFKMAEKMINYIPFYGIARYYGLGVTDTLRKSEFIDAEFKKKGIEYAKREGELRNKQLAQVLTGHLLALAFWGLSQIDWEDEDGKVVPFVDASAGYYGTGRANREKLREALPEYTMRVGNFKFSYKTNPLLAMIALPFGVIKDSERAYEEMDFADWANVYLNKELASFLYESTPIKGLQEFFKNIGETLDIEDEDRTWEDVAKIPVKQAAALGANLAVDNIYKQMFDFYDPTKYVVQDNKEVVYKAMNMENIGGLQTDYDRWGRDIKFYPGEAFFPVQYLFKDKTDKEITDWEIKNEITIPKINRKTLVLTDRKLKTEKAIEKQKEELRKDYGVESEEYKLFEETLNADFKLLTYSEFQAYDKTVRSEVLNIIKTNFDNVTEEYKKFYKESINSEERNIKPVSKLSRPDARNLVELLFKIKKKEYINKNFTKLEQE